MPASFLRRQSLQGDCGFPKRRYYASNGTHGGDAVGARVPERPAAMVPAQTGSARANV